MTVHDRRLHAFRPDLADARLQGAVNAGRFVAGRPARIGVPVADLRRAPRPDSPLDSQLLHGDEVTVFEAGEGWAWVQAKRDLYVGYVADSVLMTEQIGLTHRIVVPRTFVYPGPDLKLPLTGQLSLGCGIAATGQAETRGTQYLLLASGEAVVARHCVPLGQTAPDYVAVAETLLHTPYLWGGASGFGIDCSGLVQLSMRMAGRNVLRDTDLQQGSIGEPVEPGSELTDLRRGDLVFWAGHVAIMTDADHIIHATGHTMTVTREPLREAVERVAHLYGRPVAFRRP